MSHINILSMLCYVFFNLKTLYPISNLLNGHITVLTDNQTPHLRVPFMTDVKPNTHCSVIPERVQTRKQ